MKIAIISDVHDNLPNLKKVLVYCSQNNIEKIICCGDLAALETLDFLNDNFKGEIFYCFGNMDTEHLREIKFSDKYKNTFINRYFGETEIENNKISFTHYPEDAKELCGTGKYKFVFYGHTHKPWTEKIKNCIMLNPGNIANQFFPPTFAILDLEKNKFELIRINDIKF